MFKKILAFFMTAVLAASMLCVPAGAVDSASLSDVYWDSENEKVCFTLKFSGSTDSAWIGIVPAGTKKDEKSADSVDITYKYLSQMKSGQKDSLTAKGLKDGKYELHVYANDNGGKYLCGVSFSTTASSPSASLSDVYWDSSKETVYFTLTFDKISDSGAWIGIVPAGTKKDEKSADSVDITYKHLSKMKSGQKDSLTAKGLKDGKYELHVYANDNGGEYLCGTSFNVGKSTVEGKISEIAISMEKGDKVKLTSIVDPSSADVKWSSSNEKVATVSSSGKVTAKGKGTAIITAKSGSSSKTIKIIVED